MTGCRHNAKNTLVKNYLYLAERGGATVVPHTTAVAVRPLGPAGYAVNTVRTGAWRPRGQRRDRPLPPRIRMELIWIDALRAQPPGMPPLAALRASLHDAFASLSADDLAKLRETTDFALSVSAVRARMLDEFARTIQVMATAVAERAGRNPDDCGRT